VKEFAALLRVHPNTIRKMIKENRLHPIKSGLGKNSRYSIPEDDLLRLRAEAFREKAV
jgi:excisionase family DNA binding protein